MSDKWQFYRDSYKTSLGDVRMPSSSYVPLLAAYDALLARNAELKAALRKHTVGQFTFVPVMDGCDECETRWPSDGPELHAPGCLAALQSEVKAAALSLAQDDLAAILRAVGLSDAARPYSPHEVVQRDLLPRLRRLASESAGRPE